METRNSDNLLKRILDATISFSADLVLPATAIVGIAYASFVGTPMPPGLEIIAAGIGVDRLGRILAKFDKGQDVSTQEIKTAVAEALADSRLEEMLSDPHLQGQLDTLLTSLQLLGPGFAHREDSLIAQIGQENSRYHIAILESLNDLKAQIEAHKGEVADIVVAPRAPIPLPPEQYVREPFTLGSTFVGRKNELHHLDKWLDGNAPVMTIEAPAGMGKSALSWHWFQNQTAPPLAGKFWWSFNNPKDDFDTFVLHALAYVTRRTYSEVMRIPQNDRIWELQFSLDSSLYLLILDGFEELLQATEVRSSSGISRPTSNRSTLDLRVGQFLKQLVLSSKSKTLINTRQYPSALETLFGDPIAGAERLLLEGLSDRDALALWQSRADHNEPDSLIHVLNRLGNHPLAIQLLVSELSHYYAAPGSLDAWVKSFPDLAPLLEQLQLDEWQATITSTDSLDKTRQRVLSMVAIYDGVVDFDSLLALMPDVPDRPKRPVRPKKGSVDSLVDQLMEAVFGREEWEDYDALEKSAEDEVFEEDSAKYLIELDKYDTARELATPDLQNALRDLESHSLIGWDREKKCFTIHEITRLSVRNLTSARDKDQLLLRASNYLESIFADNHDRGVTTEISKVQELFSLLTRQERYDEAFDLYLDNFFRSPMGEWVTPRQRIKLLEQLFPKGTGALPSLSAPEAQNVTLSHLSSSLLYSGRPGQALELYQVQVHHAVEMQQEVSQPEDFISEAFTGLAESCFQAGLLYSAEYLAQDLMQHWLGGYFPKLDQALSHLRLFELSLTARGELHSAEKALQTMYDLLDRRGITNSWLSAWFAELALLRGEISVARTHLNEALEGLEDSDDPGFSILLARLAGTADLAEGNYLTGRAQLSYSVAKARSSGLVAEEIHGLNGLAKAHLLRNEAEKARNVLGETIELAINGPYPMLGSDALNILAEIEQDSGNDDIAGDVASVSYQLAWCQGPPYAYLEGLTTAQRTLESLGRPLPEMPAFEPPDREIA